jgi:hypothetical protein
MAGIQMEMRVEHEEDSTGSIDLELFAIKGSGIQK